MTTTPVRLDRLQAGLGDWISAVLPTATVVWSGTGFPRANAGELVVTLRMLSPPSDSSLGGASVTTRTLPLTATVTLGTPTAGEAVRLAFSGLAWQYEIGAGETATDARDGLLAAVGPAPLVDVAIASVGSDKISLTPTSIGDLYSLSTRGTTLGLISHTIDTSALAQIEVSEVSTQIEMQAWSTNPTPRGGAAAALSRLLSSRRLASRVDIMDAYGISIVGVPPRPIDISQLSGPDYSSRASVSLYISQVSFAAEAITPIEIVAGTLTTPNSTPGSDTAISSN